eukprot:SAG11_NODE_19271_length_470_cov_1.320755_1_plen_54_part_10
MHICIALFTISMRAYVCCISNVQVGRYLNEKLSYTDHGKRERIGVRRFFFFFSP